MAFLLALLWAAPAHALTQNQTGSYVELGAGGGLASSPVTPAVGGHLSFGLWNGTYDDAYAFGRYWSLGTTTRVDYLPSPGLLTVAPMLELRRGLDVFVANPAGFLAGGPILAFPDGGPTVGATARAGLAMKWRRHRFWGVTFRLEGGADFSGGSVSPVAGLMVGVGFARPNRHMDKLPKR